MPLHSGDKQGRSDEVVATYKAKWQAEIRAYTAHLHLTDGKMDMSEDLGYACPSQACDCGADLLTTWIAACQGILSATERISSQVTVKRMHNTTLHTLEIKSIVLTVDGTQDTAGKGLQGERPCWSEQHQGRC